MTYHRQFIKCRMNAFTNFLKIVQLQCLNTPCRTCCLSWEGGCRPVVAVGGGTTRHRTLSLLQSCGGWQGSLCMRCAPYSLGDAQCGLEDRFVHKNVF